ncbi:unnamed protein product [Camellia sinensis]
MRVLKTKRKVELHSKPHQMKKNMKIPMRMKAMPCLVEILKSTSRKTIMEEEDLSRKSTTKITRKKPIICYECKNPGHMKMDCPKLKNHGKDYKRNKKAMVEAWGESEDESSSDEIENEVANLCLMPLENEDSTQDEVCFKSKAKEEKWYLDSGCSKYMTGDKSFFTKLSSKDGGFVTFGDNKKGKIIGIGSIGW